jgi:lysophospholipase L1-like esterase
MNPVLAPGLFRLVSSSSPRARVLLAVLAGCALGCGALGCGGGDVGSVNTTDTSGSSTAPATGDDGGAGPSEGGGSQTSSAMTSSPDPSDDTTTPGDGTTGEPPPSEPAVHWVGRYDGSDPTRVRMGWSATGLVVRFDGTGASVVLDDQARYFTLLVDGQLQPDLATTPGEQSYVLASGLAPGEHVVELYRRTEGSFGASVFGDVTIDGELLPPPPVDRRIEVVGDSITAGYGNEGEAPCGFSAETENAQLTYAGVAARTLGAELHMIAWSGKGVVNNYGDDVFEPMPEIYDRTIATEGAGWTFSWHPDVVIVNLGTNDFSTDGDPAENVFVPAYVDFMAHLRDVHPDAYILALSPSLFGAEATMVDGYLQSAVDERMAAGDANVGWANVNVEWVGSGCDGHPNVVTHEMMAGNLVAELESRLGW